MKSKKYEIKNMQDIINCVNAKNIEYFMVDFRNYIESAIAIKTIAEGICKDKGYDKSQSAIKTEGFTWIDDKKHNCKIELKAKP